MAFCSDISSFNLNSLGFGFPFCGSGVTVPISVNPNPNAGVAVTYSPFLSNPAPSPIGFRNLFPKTSWVRYGLSIK